jgi:thiol-disulfide isomerase/thioredoxin
VATRNGKPNVPVAEGIDISPGALYSTEFSDLEGARRSLAPYAGKLLVVNFWATWCAPCREEMPGFSRLQARWGASGVQFVGLTPDEPAVISAFSREISVNYPLWSGSSSAMELSKRLGNRLSVLPHTVLVGRDGRILESRIGKYSETDLENRLSEMSAKTQ